MTRLRQSMRWAARHGVWQCLLALALLFAQQAGQRHAMSHALGDANGKHPADVHTVLCKQCLAYADVGDAVAHVAPLPAPSLPADTLVVLRQAMAPRPSVWLGFRSRAPPSV
jgi:hypothetical protein